MKNMELVGGCLAQVCGVQQPEGPNSVRWYHPLTPAHFLCVLSGMNNESQFLTRSQTCHVEQQRVGVMCRRAGVEGVDWKQLSGWKWSRNKVWCWCAFSCALHSETVHHTLSESRLQEQTHDIVLSTPENYLGGGGTNFTFFHFSLCLTSNSAVKELWWNRNVRQYWLSSQLLFSKPSGHEHL